MRVRAYRGRHPYAAAGRLVMGCQVWQLGSRSWRYAGAGRDRWAWAEDVPRCIRRARGRVGRGSSRRGDGESAAAGVPPQASIPAWPPQRVGVEP